MPARGGWARTACSPDPVCEFAQASRLTPRGIPCAPVLGVACPSAAYQPRTPSQGVLYQVVRDHFETFREQAAGLRNGEGLPRLVGVGATGRSPLQLSRGRLRAVSVRGLRLRPAGSLLVQGNSVLSELRPFDDGQGHPEQGREMVGVSDLSR